MTSDTKVFEEGSMGKTPDGSVCKMYHNCISYMTILWWGGGGGYYDLVKNYATVSSCTSSLL